MDDPDRLRGAATAPARAARRGPRDLPADSLDRAAAAPAGDELINTRFGRIVTSLLLLFGVQVWLVAGHGLLPRNAVLLILAIVVLLPLVPPLRRRMAGLLDGLRAPSARARTVIAIAIAIIASLALYETAVQQGRVFIPYIHDEFAYLIQAQMLARLRLWMPPHPAGESFENFYLLYWPKYASIYFPGTALLNVPAAWLNLPTWLIPLACAGAVVGLLYRVVTEIVDGVAGWLCAVMLASTSVFRWMSLRVMASIPVMLFGLAMVWAYLRWRRERRARWAVLIGLFAGWAAICRPLDALCYAIPVGAVMLFQLARSRAGWRSFLATGACLVAGAAPFLSLQLIFDRGVTGRWLLTPYQLYHDQDAPGAGWGWHAFDPNAHAQSQLPQKQLYYERNIKPTIQMHQASNVPMLWRDVRLPMLTHDTLPHVLLLVLLPAGLLALGRAERWALWGMLPAFIVLYTPFTFFLPHYTLPAAPAVIFTIAMGADVVRRTWPRARGYWSVVLALCILSLSVTTWRGRAPFDRVVFDDLMDGSLLVRINAAIDALPHKPAIVLFRRGPNDIIELEPAYNPTVAWPDEAEVIRAHDRGEAINRRLFEYYARHQPQRRVYLFDRADGTLHDLGDVTDLARTGIPATLPRAIGTAHP